MPKEKDTTSYFLTNEDAATLRQVAATLGITISRGPGTGEIGSIRDLNHRLASAGCVCFDELVEALRPFVDAPGTHQEGSGARE